MVPGPGSCTCPSSGLERVGGVWAIFSSYFNHSTPTQAPLLKGGSKLKRRKRDLQTRFKVGTSTMVCDLFRTLDMWGFVDINLVLHGDLKIQVQLKVYYDLCAHIVCRLHSTL